jgi:two-component system CheB/CheR fusion protein
LEIPSFGEVLEEVLPKRQNFEGYEPEYAFPKIGQTKIPLNARRIHKQVVAKGRILLAIEDVTEKE